ncbi:type I restriction endonuclease subunit M [Priestia aryabhattai]
MGKLTLKQLESHLWKSANILRGSIDSSDYKNYIFALLFFKRLNDVFVETAKRIENEEGDDCGWHECEKHQFFVPVGARWEDIRFKTQDIGHNINRAFEKLEEENISLQGVLANLNFNDKNKLPDTLLMQLVQHFSEINLSDASLLEPDMLGHAYEYLTKQFAGDAGKKIGESYTPNKIGKLIVELLKPEESMRICDPRSGSGDMLVQFAAYIKEKGGIPSKLVIHGQEIKSNKVNICRINLLIHGLTNHRIEKGDIIREPMLVEEGELLQYDRVVANPPFSLKDWGREKAGADQYGRFRFGLPPKTAGDYAFIQHIIATLNHKGKAAVLIPQGVLFRGGAEEKIRKKIVEEDLIETIIRLPSRLFKGTDISVYILILSRNKEEKRKNKILFIDGSTDYEEGRNQNTLCERDIKKIVTAYDDYKGIEKYCRPVSIETIRANHYNLNITSYIDKTEEEEKIDVSVALAELHQLEKEREDNESVMYGYLREMGYSE